MLDYNEPLYRPPAEANSFILQVTIGCSFNKCSFCTMYESKEFRQRELKDIFLDIDRYASYDSGVLRVFLADGDALCMETDKLLEILEYLKKSFKSLRRVSTYASAFNLNDKSLEELKRLKSAGLTLIYYGLESGDFETLKLVNKPITKEKILDGLSKAHEAAMKVSLTVILGLGGKEFTKQHIKASADIINNSYITYLSTLQLVLTPNSFAKLLKGNSSFRELSDDEMLREQKLFLEELNPKNRVIFRSNHASNSLALAGTLPKDKESLLSKVEYALKNSDTLIPSFLRGF